MSQLPNPVRPGDLITAAFMNQLVALLGSLNDRVTALEAGQPPGNAVAITALNPGSPWTVGQQVQVVGRNFGFLAGACRVTLDTQAVNSFALGTNDQTLIFNVPGVAGLTSTGKIVVLTVTNQQTSDQRSVLVMPVPQPLQGFVDVLWRTDLATNPTPNPIAVGQPALFGYRIQSRANLPANFSINPVVSVPALQSSLQLLDATQAPITGGQVDVGNGQSQNFYVKIPLIPPSTSALTLTVTASSGNVTGSFSQNLTVGVAVPQPDPTITLTFDGFTAVNSIGGTDTGSTFDPVANTINVKQGSTGIMTFSATFQNAGTYDVTVALGAGSNWKVALLSTPASYNETNANALENPQFTVQPQAGATQGAVTFQVQGKGAAKSQTRTYNLAVAP
jgi:hypothetical protein